MQCQDDWFRVYGSRALDHFGRITQPKVLTQANAWRKTYDWHGRRYGDGEPSHYVYNYLTEERHSITEQQYNDETSITADGRLNI